VSGLDEVEFRLQLRVEDLVLLYTLARQEGISVHELILKAVRQYVALKMPAPSTSHPSEDGKKQ